VQGSYIRHGGFCAIGAIAEVTGVHEAARRSPGLTPIYNPRYNRATAALNEAVGDLPGLYGSVIGYNDTSSRKHEEILALFDMAIRRIAPARSRDKAFLDACAAAARRQQERELSARRFADEAELTVAGD
jgi:hypothetical protein